MKSFRIKNTDFPHAIGLYTCKKCHEIVDGVNHYGVCLNCVENKEKNKEKDKELMFVIEDKRYSTEEIIEILKKHKEEEDKKYHKCDICGDKYLENNTYNMCRYDLDEKHINPKAYAVGYSSTPYIKGIKILSTCGSGKEIKMCDKCISLLVKWLKKED